MGDSYTIGSKLNTKPTLDQAGDRDSFGRFLPGKSGNPSGKGGLADNPENINFGGRPKNEQRFGYWLQFFKDMTNAEFIKYPKTRNEDDMYVAEVIAYERVLNSRKNLKEYKDLADRTEGRAVQSLDLTTKGEKLTGIQVEIITNRDEVKTESNDSI